MIKILIVFGTRPEAIKMCPLIIEMKKYTNIDYKVCLTGQHREMLDQVISLFDVNVDYDLNIMEKEQTLTEISIKILKGMDTVLNEVKPDMVLVHGDTTTSFITTLSAFYHKIPVGHVEAGLRTYNIYSPYPEEFNRQAVDIICDMYFAPTNNAKNNLLKEGKNTNDIFVTGNTVIDALNTTIKHDFIDDNIFWAKDSRMILVTSHRRENLGKKMKGMFNAIKRIANDYDDVKIIFPVHKNPKVRKLAYDILGDVKNIRLIEPLDPVSFHNYMNNCYLILTDSGGVQEEAPTLGKPVLVMRDTTERPEGVEAGTLKLVGSDETKIYFETKKLLDDNETYKKMSEAKNPFGDGMASKRIVESIISRLC